MDACLSYHGKNEPRLWVNPALKKVIHAHQKALAKGDLVTFHSLRNDINCKSKSQFSVKNKTKDGIVIQPRDGKKLNGMYIVIPIKQSYL